jgi:hypothetical protein
MPSECRNGFDHSFLGEQDGDVLAARDSGEPFEQQSLGVFHCDGLSESEICLVLLSWFGGLARTLIERREYVSQNVLQYLVRKRWRSLRDHPWRRKTDPPI